MSNEPSVNFFRVSHLIVGSHEFKQLSPKAQALYFQLCRLRNRLQEPPKTYFYQSRTDLAGNTGMKRYTLEKAERELLNSHFIWVRRKQGSSTRYHIWEAHDSDKVG